MEFAKTDFGKQIWVHFGILIWPTCENGMLKWPTSATFILIFYRRFRFPLTVRLKR